MKLIRTTIAGLYFIIECYAALFRMIFSDYCQKVRKDAEYQASLKKYSDAVMSLERKQQKLNTHSLDTFDDALDDTQPIRIEQDEISAKDLEDWAK